MENVKETARKKRGGKGCIAALCSKTNHDGVSLHKFPADLEAAKLWSKQVKKREG